MAKPVDFGMIFSPNPSPAHRTFPYRLNRLTFYEGYLRWLRHLRERLGQENTLALWQRAFTGYDDASLTAILATGWRRVAAGEVEPHQVDALLAGCFPPDQTGLSPVTPREIIENTPPIRQIGLLFDGETREKDITAYDALHLRFDGFATLAEALIADYGKQGELIVYDLMAQSRLAAAGGQTGSVAEFIADFTAIPAAPSLFSAGLQFEVIHKTDTEAIVHVQACEWARYFRQRHPEVGYLMACSTDEIAYRAFNPCLRLQRRETLMEGGELCDFQIFAVEPPPTSV